MKVVQGGELVFVEREFCFIGGTLQDFSNDDIRRCYLIPVDQIP